MERKALSPARIARLPLNVEVPDTAVPGIYVLRRPSGREVFIWRYRRPSTKKHAKLVLGHYTPHEQETRPGIGGVHTLAAARALAIELKRKIRLGIDPGLLHREAKTEADLSRKNTFAQVAYEFVTKYSKRNKRWRTTSRTLGFKVNKDDSVERIPKKGSLAHKWRDTAIADIKKREIVQLLDAIVERGAPYVAINLHSLLAKLFNWAASRDVITVSPMLYLGKPAVSQSRDRVLNEREIRALWKAVDQVSEPWAACVRLLLLTGTRRDEARCAPYDEFQGNIWTIPKERTKNGRELILDLPKLAMQQVGVRNRSRWVFTARYRHPINSMGRFKQLTDDLMREELGDQYRDWRLHDLRRTAITGMARIGIAPHVCEAVANHASGQISGVAAVYNRNPYEAEKRDALIRWEAEVLRIVDPAAADDPMAQGRYVMQLETLRAADPETEQPVEAGTPSK